MKVVVVESPTKAKTISKYLDNSYKVIASYGHVRNLISKDGSVLPEEEFSMKWDLESRGMKHVSEIKKALDGADELILATDPDREGEAICWHLCEVLSKQLHNIRVSRITFHEITKTAIINALNDTKEIDYALVDAYLARCALDYLVGFKLSPVLWRKLPGSRSAGRVQSVALRLVYEREVEISNFKSMEYWNICGLFNGKDKNNLKANLVFFNDKKLDKFSINNEEEANEAVNKLKNLQYEVSKVETKEVRRNPVPPFITSTLQQEGVRKLGFTAKKTMQLAQKLYEGVDVDGQPVGLITYMRTDSTNISEEAIKNIRNFIQVEYGENYLPKSKNVYSKKVKNAQEAHEGIRPTNIEYTPEKLNNILNKDLLKLYSLIWKRALSSQMTQAVFTQISIDIADLSGKNIFHSSGSKVKFDGFLKIYEESFDDMDKEDSYNFPNVEVKQSLKLENIEPEQHFTQPPARYTEASLIKNLENLGIGRPSTYANIIFVLNDRNYIAIEKKRFFLQNRGFLVSVFLMEYFARYVEYDFTANLEQELDDISTNKKQKLVVLNSFWGDFNKTLENAAKLKIAEVIMTIEKKVENFLFKNKDGNIDKSCPSCKGNLGLKLGKFGPFISCSNYPECKFVKKILSDVELKEEGEGDVAMTNIDLGNNVVGKYNYNGVDVDVLLKQGPYGFYLETKLGSDLKRSSLPKFIDVKNLTEDVVEFLISLPKILGKHPLDGEEILISIGKFGPYIKHGSKFVSVKNFDDFKGLDLVSAVTKLSAKK